MSAVNDLLDSIKKPTTGSAVDKLLAGGREQNAEELIAAGAIPTAEIESVTGPLPEPGDKVPRSAIDQRIAGSALEGLAFLADLANTGFAGNVPDLITGRMQLPEGQSIQQLVNENITQPAREEILGADIPPAVAAIADTGAMAAGIAAESAVPIGGVNKAAHISAARKVLAGQVGDAAKAAGKSVDQVAKELFPSGLDGVSTDEVVSRAQRYVRLQQRASTESAARDEFVGTFFAEPAGEPARKGLLETVQGATRKFYQLMINREAPLERAGLKQLVQRNRGVLRSRDAPIQRGTFLWDDTLGERVAPEAIHGHQAGRSLVDRLAGVPDEAIADVRGVMAAERQLELVGRGLKGIKEGTQEAAEAALGEIKGRYGDDFVEIQGIVDDVRQWADEAILQRLHNAGRLDDKQLAAIRSSNEKYSPILKAAREIGDDEITVVGQHSDPLKKITTGLDPDNPALDPLEALIIQAQRTHVFAEKNILRRELLGYADSDPAFTAEFALNKVKRGASGRKGVETFDVWRDGSRETYEATDEMLSALDVYSPGQLRAFQKFRPLMVPLQLGASTLRAGATLTLEFATRNFMRDQFTAAIYSKYGYVPFWDMGRALFDRYARGGSEAWDTFLDSGSAMSSFVSLDRPGVNRQLADVVGRKAAGVPTRRERLVGAGRRVKSSARKAFNDVMEGYREDGWKYVPQILAAGIRRTPGAVGRSVATGLRRSPETVSRGVLGTLKPFQVVSEALEEGTRAGAIQAGLRRRKKGQGMSVLPSLDVGLHELLRTRSPKNAIRAFKGARETPPTLLDLADEAREITLDFGRQGEFGRVWNSVEAFVNAQLQDMDKFTRAMVERPLTTTMRGFGYVSMPSIGFWFKNRNDERYQNLPEWEKMLFWHVGWTEDDRPIRFPKPNGMLGLTFGYAVEKALDGMAEQGDEDALRDIAVAFGEQTPLQYVGGSGIQETASGRVPDFTSLLEALPTGVQPFIESAVNRSAFRGAPIEPFGLQSRAPEARFLEHTSPTIRAVTPALAKLPILGSSTQRSPMRTENLFRGLTGGVGQMALDVSDQFVGDDSGVPPVPRGLRDVPLVRAFVGSKPYGPGSAPMNDFFELMTRVDQATKTSRDMPELHEKMVRQNPEAIYHKQLGVIRRGIQDLMRVRRQIVSAKDMSSQEKERMIQWIDMAMTQQAASGLFMVEDAEQIVEEQYGAERVN